MGHRSALGRRGRSARGWRRMIAHLATPEAFAAFVALIVGLAVWRNVANQLKRRP